MKFFSSLGNAAWGRRNDDDPVNAKGYIESICITRLLCFDDTLALQYSMGSSCSRYIELLPARSVVSKPQ